MTINIDAGLIKLKGVVIVNHKELVGLLMVEIDA